MNLLNEIICGDCITVLKKVDKPFADLIFADPPFNIGYKYDKYHDKIAKEEYSNWTYQWMSECFRILKQNGSFYVAIGDEHVTDAKIAADKLKLEMRNWIIWHYSFGQQMANKFARSHTHILYFVKNPKEFTFNAHTARVISDRQKKYRDKRANPDGKMPDDVWDEYPRLCGTFEERTEFPCQMPESLLARIIRVSSNEGDWVLDPFSGSGTTAAVAAKLRRNYTGIELSSVYSKESRQRIERCPDIAIEGEGSCNWNSQLDSELKWLYHENKIPTEQLCDEHNLLVLFTDKFNKRIETTYKFQPPEIKKRLIQLRKSAKLGPLRGQPILTFSNGNLERI